MNGMERLTDAAARHGWERRPEPRGYSRTVHYTRGNQEMEVYRRLDGGVTYGTRNWGSRTSATAPKVTDQVLTWMQEPTPDDGTDRGFFFRLATDHGWTFKGIDSGDVYVWSAHRITLRFGAAGVLIDAQRNFGVVGEIRSINTNVPANITPWFHAFMDAAHECGCTKPEPVVVPVADFVQRAIRPAVPQTPDRKLRKLMEDLKEDARSLSADAEKFRRVGLAGDFTVAELEELSVRLEDLSRAAFSAHREAMYLMVERASSKETADILRKLHAAKIEGQG